MTITPLSLLERLRQHPTEKEWDRFVDLYTPLLSMWARRLGLQPSDADDLVQEVFVILVRELPRFAYQPEKRFRGWLWTILVNKHRERLRRRPAADSPVGNGAILDAVGEDVTTAVDEAEYRQYLVQRALQLMQSDFEPATWKAFYECVTADRPASEVAAELDLSVEAVYAAKSRVLRRLREELAGLCE